MDKKETLLNHYITEIMEKSEKDMEYVSDFSSGFIEGIKETIAYLEEVPRRLQEYKLIDCDEQSDHDKMSVSLSNLHNRHLAKTIDALKKHMSFYTNDIQSCLNEIDKK